MADSRDPDALFDRGDALSAEGMKAVQAGDTETGHARWREAIEVYRSAIAAAPPDDPLLAANLELCIGARHIGLGEIDRALAVTEAVIDRLAAPAEAGGEAAEVHAQARLNRADCRLASGDQETALREVEEVLAAFPDHPYGTFLLERCRGA